MKTVKFERIDDGYYQPKVDLRKDKTDYTGAYVALSKVEDMFQALLDNYYIYDGEKDDDKPKFQLGGTQQFYTAKQIIDVFI